jgi:UDP-N-acetylglucosamine 2-epimerase
VSRKKIAVIIGARPQFIKHAPLEQVLKNHFNIFSIHTGQHYDAKMSSIFFEQMEIDRPKYMLNSAHKLHGKMTASMLAEIEEILLLEIPDAVIVYGDTNTTLAGALAASKLHIPIFHVEAGLRSFNRKMPEEINRIVTDHLSSLLFAPTDSSVINLNNEGIFEGINIVGDLMYDSLILAKKYVGENIKQEDEILLTIHRPYNTDNFDRLSLILEQLNKLNKKVIFPVHPRTKDILNKNHFIFDNYENIQFIEPVSYFDLVKLQIKSSCIITDSGGIQKEAYMLRRKCITIRSETEWIETLVNGWNTLIFEDLGSLSKIINTQPGEYISGVYGNGDASLRIIKYILLYFENGKSR